MKTVEIFEIGEIVYWVGLSDDGEVPVADEVIGIEVTSEGVIYTLNDYGKIEDFKVYPSKDECEKAIVFEAIDEINDIRKDKEKLFKKYGITVEIITPKNF